MVFHAQVVAIFLELDTSERLGEEVGDVHVGADVPYANRLISHVVSDFEVARVEMPGALAGLWIVDRELDRLVVDPPLKFDASGGSFRKYDTEKRMARDS